MAHVKRTHDHSPLPHHSQGCYFRDRMATTQLWPVPKGASASFPEQHRHCHPKSSSLPGTAASVSPSIPQLSFSHPWLRRALAARALSCSEKKINHVLESQSRKLNNTNMKKIKHPCFCLAADIPNDTFHWTIHKKLQWHSIVVNNIKPLYKCTAIHPPHITHSSSVQIRSRCWEATALHCHQDLDE